MGAELRPEHDPVRSVKREMVVVQKIQPDQKGWAGGFRVDFCIALTLRDKQRTGFEPMISAIPM